MLVRTRMSCNVLLMDGNRRQVFLDKLVVLFKSGGCLV